MEVSGFQPGATTGLHMVASAMDDTSMFSSWSKHNDEHQRLTDSGYDSIIYSSLTCSSLSSSVSTNNSFFASSASNSDASNSSSVFSQPSTPIKQKLAGATNGTTNGMLFTRHNSTTTPDLKHQYVADINAFYLASLRSPAKVSNNFNSNSFRSCNFGDFSASNSASPVKLSDSPKFVNPDDFLRERDNLTSKLLRSPAFKFQQSSNACSSLFSPQRSFANGHFESEPSKPFIQSFSSRFLKATSMSSSVPSASRKTAQPAGMFSPESSALPSPSSVRTTPTEEEFMEMLIKNCHMPNNPEFLIGRRMGVEKLDILSELNKRSMKNVIDHILSYTTKTDYVRMAGVSREWRDVIQQNKHVNGERVRYLKLRKQLYEKSKENQCHCNPASLIRSQLANQWRTLDSLSSLNQLRQELTMEQKRRSFKVSRDQPGSTVNDDVLSPQDRRLCSLDMNCLNNVETQNRVLKSATIEANASSNRIIKPAASRLNIAFSIGEAMETDDISPVTTISHKEAFVSAKRSPLKAINLLDSAHAPSFITKHLKVSPVKSSCKSHIEMLQTPSTSSTIYHSTMSPKKLDIIGSKKSKKNLKRL